MELNEIMQYSHKITKIAIINDNTKSSYKYVTIKIHLDRGTNESIRFSTVENPTSESEWLDHQSAENDFFLRIPNETPSKKYIYAHYFPSELYDYTEVKQVFSRFKFKDFFEETPKDQWGGNEYHLQIKSSGYEMLLGDDNKPLIRSLLKQSLTRYKDPNYKNYITSGIGDTTFHMTEKGRLPLSSRYRNSLYNIAPQFNQTTLPHWDKSEIKYSNGDTPIVEEDRRTYPGTTLNNSDGLNDCQKREQASPFWEAKIHRTGLSPLISETDETQEDENPINVYLNYQYLPTSTEYHQHYFGFEGKHLVDGEQKTKNRTYEVIDGEGLTDINQNFGTQEKTYRLIRHGNPYDNRYSMNLEHKNIYDVNLTNDVTLKENCSWERNNCQKYWTYKSEGKGAVYLNVPLKANTYYVLKYFMFIPADAYIEDDSCYIEVQSAFKRPIYNNNPSDSLIISGGDIVQKGETIVLKAQLKDELQDITEEPKTLTNRLYLSGSQVVQNENNITIKATFKDDNGAPLDGEVIKYYEITPDKEVVDNIVSFYMETDDKDVDIIGELPEEFKRQDKYLRHEWIYHEIPFYTSEVNNKIVIKGPQHAAEGLIGINYFTNEIITNVTDEVRNNPYIQIHDCKNDVIYFYSVQIAEMVEYSPTLKYTKTGMYITEGNQYAKKPLGENKNDDCTPDTQKNATNEWQKHQDMIVSDRIQITGGDITETDANISLKATLKDVNNNPDSNKVISFYIEDDTIDADSSAISMSNTWINKGTTQLPMPLTDIYIFFDNEFTIMYNKLTTELSYTRGDFAFRFDAYNEKLDESIQWVTDDAQISLLYDRLTTPLSDATTSQNHENRNEGDTNINNLLTAELKLLNTQEKRFTTGINNSFNLKLQDAYGVPITIGEVECSIWTSNKEENTPCSEAYKCLGIHTPDANGVIEFKKLNFKKFKPSRDTYYLRIKYHHYCYDKDIIKWKELKFEEEYINMSIYTNTTYENNNCPITRCIEQNDCCKLKASSYITEVYEYDKKSYIQYIDSVNELPLRLDVVLRSQPLSNGDTGNIIDEGYCELSVNDKVIQTTFVDSCGVADFYLDENDLDPGIQIIKVEYFKSPNDDINYAFFPINCRADMGYDERPAIPILINKITTDTITQLTTGIYEVPTDDIFFCNIDTSTNEHPFSVTIEKNNEKEVKNVPANIQEDFIIAAMYSGNPRDKYIITTGNAKKSDGSDDNHDYCTTKKEFTVQWVSN